MKKKLLTTFLCLCSIALLIAQETRTYDGTNNNLSNPTWGAVGSQLARQTTVAYADSISQVGGVGWPNPREVSNLIFQQDDPVPDLLELSDYVWVFGQFIDHDITLVDDTENNWIYIQVPQGDPWFDPWGWGAALIPMRRSIFDPTTGTSIDNPRQHINSITAFVDGSAVYGSDQDRADWLRTFQNGKLKTSAGNLLPFNTLDGEFDGDLDLDAPEMADPVGLSDKHFVAGDVRANENPLLTAFHTLFVREHNRLCEALVIQYPNWTDEELYQHARRMVGGFIQSIVYEQWLPAMGVHLAPYDTYNSTMDPAISNVFSAAAFRLGHTLLGREIVRMDMNGEVIPEGNLALKDAFFNPLEVMNAGGIDPLFKGMGTQIQQDCDVKVIDDVRNFLFGPPGQGGMDLASINMMRGRERGIPDFNTVREDFGLMPYSSFLELTENEDFANKLASLYNSVDEIDAWVGMLAEKHMPDALFGETIMEIMVRQFTALRNGDRFYYENDPALAPEEKAEIKNTMLEEIIRRNTNIPIMQNNVFYAMPHEMLCTAQEQATSIAGTLQTVDSIDIVSEVTVDIYQIGEDNPIHTELATNGYQFPQMPTCEAYEVVPTKDINVANGVTTLDMVITLKHILGVEFMNSPYQLIAADVNNSGTVTTMDLVHIRRVILMVDLDFEYVDSWKFIPTAHSFLDPTNPWLEPIPDRAIFDNLLEAQTVDFLGIKMGDVNFSADPSQLMTSDDRTANGALRLEIENQRLVKDQMVTATFTAADFASIAGYQFTLNYDRDALEFVNIQQEALKNLDANNFNVMEAEGAITTNWVGVKNTDESALFSIQFVAKTTGKELGELLSLNSRYTEAQAVRQNLTTLDVALEFKDAVGTIAQGKFELYQNQPNPFNSVTKIGFQLPGDTEVKLSVFDVTGNQLFVLNDWKSKGYHEVEIQESDLNASGVLYYRLETKFGQLTKKMILID